MRVILKWSIVSTVATALYGCDYRVSSSHESSRTFSDVDVPKEGIVSAEQLKNINVGFLGYVNEGEQEVDLRDFAEALKIDGPLKEKLPEILASREPTASINCSERRCRFVSLGESYSFVADWINIPLFGKPTIYLGPVIVAEVVVSEDGNKAEICKLLGIRGKAGVVQATPDGMRYELAGTEIKEFVMDTGSGGGTYPIEACNPDGKFE